MAREEFIQAPTRKVADLSFSVGITPVSKGRARVTRSGHAFTPKTTRTAESLIAQAYMDAEAPRRHPGPVVVLVSAAFPVPASWPKWKREQALRGEWPCTCVKDVDNLAKTVTDALNDLAYTDDRQIIELRARKHYAEVPGLSIYIAFLEEPRRAS